MRSAVRSYDEIANARAGRLSTLLHSRSCRFVPVLFDEDISSGRGTLTEAGRKVLKEEFDMVDR